MTLHTCSYHCDRPECIRAQRDYLRDKMDAEREQFSLLCDTLVWIDNRCYQDAEIVRTINAAMLAVAPEVGE